MRAAISSVIASMLLLGSCEKPRPDFVISLRSTDGDRTATFSGYQPRGIAEGYVLLTFGKGDKKSDESAALFQQIENGQVGWISNDTIAIIADELKFNNLASDYFPDGTVGSRIRLITCTKQNMDCSSIQKQLLKANKTRRIAQFPEGGNYGGNYGELR